MTNRKDITVVVLSRNYSTGISVIRSLGEKGYTVDLIASAKEEGKSAMAGASKYLRNYSEFVTSKVKAGDNDEVVEKLMEYRGSKEKQVLLPTDDYTASLVDKNREKSIKVLTFFVKCDIMEGDSYRKIKNINEIKI